MNILYLIISLVCGAVGGNIAGALMKDKSLGTLGNSLAGILAAASAGRFCRPCIYYLQARVASIWAASSPTSPAAAWAAQCCC